MSEICLKIIQKKKGIDEKGDKFLKILEALLTDTQDFITLHSLLCKSFKLFLYLFEKWILKI